MATEVSNSTVRVMGNKAVAVPLTRGKIPLTAMGLLGASRVQALPYAACLFGGYLSVNLPYGPHPGKITNDLFIVSVPRQNGAGIVIHGEIPAALITP